VTIPLDSSKSGRVLTRRQAERVDSIIDDPEVEQEVLRDFSARARLPMPSSGVYVPLLLRERAIGVIAIHDKIRSPYPDDLRFSAEDVQLAEALAARAAVAVDLSHRVQRDALRRVVQAQEAERTRIARELHDETGQALTSILLGLRAAEEARDDDARRAALATLRELATGTLHDVRRLAVELRPKALDDFGLVAALERLIDGFRERTRLEIEFEARLSERLPRDTEIALYRIVQEALTNIVKHAEAHRVSILLGRKDGSVTAVIEDDGRGFALQRALLGDGLGLVGMKERMELLGGRLTIESSRGRGTTLFAEVPLQ
jgi:signal transduction histidine kinase